MFLCQVQTGGEYLQHRITHPRKIYVALIFALGAATVTACAPRIVGLSASEGAPQTPVNISLEYLVGWPRVEVGGKMLDWPQLKLSASEPARHDVPGEELIWIEDKVLQFKIPDLPPGDYIVTIHDDKGPPNDPIYSFLETTAYVIFPPVWPFVFRPNQTQFTLRVLPRE